MARDFLADVRCIVRGAQQMGLLRTAQYQRRISGDVFSTPAVNYPAFRQPRQSGDTSGLAETTTSWTLLADDGQEETALNRPKRLGKFTVEETGEVWHVHSAQWSYNDLVFECQCSLQV